MVQSVIEAPAAPPVPTAKEAPPSTARNRVFLGMVALAPVHTVSLSAWVSWKPFLGLLVVLVAWDAAAGARARSWPWHRPASMAAAVFLATALASWPGPETVGRFSSLWLGLGVGVAVMAVTERGLRVPGMMRRLLRTVFWSGAAMAVSAVAFGLVAVGALGRSAGDAIGDVPGVWRVVKPAYLDSGFVALTNWHHEAGYAAAWMTLWLALALLASWLGAGTGRRWVDAAVIGGLGFGVVMTFSRAGWVTLGLSVALTAVIAREAGAVGPREAAATVARAALVALVLFGALFALDRPGVAGDLAEQFSFRADQQATLATDRTPESPERLGDDRASAWPEYWGAFTDNPIRGIGLGSGWETPGLQEPHNLGLQLLAEMGLLGAAGFLVLASVVIYAGGGPVGRVALVAAVLPAFALTVLFEPTLWLAAGIYLAGGIGAAAQRRPPDPYRAVVASTRV